MERAFVAVMLPRVRSPLVRSVVVAGLLAKLARVMLPVPVKLTALAAAWASVTVPTTEWAPAPWVIPAALVTESVPVAVLPFNVIPPAVSVRAMLLPVAPTATKSTPPDPTPPRVMAAAPVPVPALRVTTEPVVFAITAAAPWVIVPLVAVPVVLIETRPVVDATAGAMVNVLPAPPERTALPPFVRTSKPPPTRGVPTRFTLTGPVAPKVALLPAPEARTKRLPKNLPPSTLTVLPAR